MMENSFGILMALQTPARNEATFFAPLKINFMPLKFSWNVLTYTHTKAIWKILPFPLQTKPTRISTPKKNKMLSHTHSRIPSLPSSDQNSTLCTADPDSFESPWTHMKLRDATRCQNKGIFWIEKIMARNYSRHKNAFDPFVRYSIRLVRREQGNLIAKLIFHRRRNRLHSRDKNETREREIESKCS